MLYDGWRGESRIGAAKRCRHVGVPHRHAFHVQLVDDCFVPWNVRPTVIPPREGGIDHPAFRHAGCGVTPVECEILALGAEAIPIVRIAPVDVAGDRFRVRVEQELVRIEAMTLFRAIGSIDAIPIEQPGPRFRQIAMPDQIIVFHERDALDFPPPLRIEDAELDFLRVLREQREIDAFSVPRRSTRVRPPCPDCGDRFRHRSFCLFWTPRHGTAREPHSRAARLSQLYDTRLQKESFARRRVESMISADSRRRGGHQRSSSSAAHP